MVKADAAAKRIALAKEEIQRWNKDVQKDKAAHNQRNQLINFGGVHPEAPNPAAAYRYEGRNVAMDFFQSPRGPPGDLRQLFYPKDNDRFPGKQGLAGEYAGNREKENPFEWNAVWEEMGIPGETRVGLQMEAAADKKRGAPQRRVIQDRGVYPAVQGEALQREAIRVQQEFGIERAKLLAARMGQILAFDDMRDDVMKGRIVWERNKGEWAIKGQVRDDNLILLARKGVDFLNETPYDFDRPAGNRRPARQHEMLSQLARAPTIRDLNQLPRPNPPYAWIDAKSAEAHGNGTTVHEPQCDRYPPRKEWDVRSLMRGERRTVAIRRAEAAQVDISAGVGQDAGAAPEPFVLEGAVERAEEWERAPTVRLAVDRQHRAELNVLYPGGRRWAHDTWQDVAPAIVTVRHAPNRNLGLNREFLVPPAGDGLEPGVDLQGLGPVEVELMLNPTTEEINVFHHVGQLVQEPTQMLGDKPVKIQHGGSLLPPDRRYGIKNVKPPPTGKIVGGEWEWGDCGVLGSDDRLLGRAHPFRDGNGDEEVHGAAALCKIRIQPNANHGLNRNLLNPPAPQPGEKFQLRDRGDGRVEVGYRIQPSVPAQNRHCYRRDDLRPVSACNTFCHR